MGLAKKGQECKIEHLYFYQHLWFIEHLYFDFPTCTKPCSLAVISQDQQIGETLKQNEKN